MRHPSDPGGPKSGIAAAFLIIDTAHERFRPQPVAVSECNRNRQRWHTSVPQKTKYRGSSAFEAIQVDGLLPISGCARAVGASIGQVSKTAFAECRQMSDR